MHKYFKAEDDFDGQTPSNPIMVIREQSVLNRDTVFFDRELKNPSDYTNLIMQLNSANEGDSFIFRFMACPGGRIDVTLPIYNAIMDTNAQTLGVLESHSASGATMLLMACDSVLVQPHASMMVHGASYGSVGHMSSIRNMVNFSESFISKLFMEVYEGFLTDEEIKHLLSTDHDMNLEADEIVERLEARNEYRINKEQALQEKPIKKGNKK